jgi:hypothetical protein
MLLQASTAIVISSFSAVYDTENYGFGMSSRVIISLRNFVKIGQLIQKFNRTQLAHARQPNIINPTACHFRKESAPLYVGGLINFASTVKFFIYEYIKHIWIKPVLCSHVVFLFLHTSPWTQMLTVLTQCTSKWKSFQEFGSHSVLLLNY